MNNTASVLPRSALAIALLSALAASPVLAQEQAEGQSAQALDTIQVTARKRTENIVEVPMNISAVSASELEARNLTEVNDIYRTVAGGASPTGQLILRGLSGSNASAPNTTSQFVDGVPLGMNNIMDVQRVEVLRGPQGTLWGSNAIGGTVQVVTNKPQAQYLEGFFNTRVSSEDQVSGVSTRFEAGLNAPLVEDRLALRVAASTHTNQRQIVNTATGKQGSNGGEVLRAQLRFEPNENVWVNLGYTNIYTRTEGRTVGDRSRPGGYEVATMTANPNAVLGYDVTRDWVACDPAAERAACFTGGNPGTNAPTKFQVWERMDPWSKANTDLVSLSFGLDSLFGDRASLNYVGSWRNNTSTGLDDWSRIDGEDLVNSWIINDNDSSRVTHELRLQSNQRMAGFDWTVGVFEDRFWAGYKQGQQYQYHDASTPAQLALSNAVIWDGAVSSRAREGWAARGIYNLADLGQNLYGDVSKNLSMTNVHNSSSEQAAFGELNYQFDTGVGRFEATAGIRYYRLKDHSATVQDGVWYGPAGREDSSGGQESGNRKKVSLAWLPAQNINVYALYSEGYRPGGNNAPLAYSCEGEPDAAGYVRRYTSDKIDNYELGFKANLFDRRFNISSAVYHIDWSGIHAPVFMARCGSRYMSNAVTARSRGVELETQTWLGNTTTLSFNAGYTDASMTADAPHLSAVKGDSMPMVPKYNGYLALDHGFDLFNRQASARVDVSTYGPYKTHFNARETNQVSGYTTVNLSGRIELNPAASLGLFVNNVFNREYMTYRNASYPDYPQYPQYERYGIGRTIGARLDLRFD